MVAERFKILLEELGQAMNIALEPDVHNACRLHFKDDFNLTMQPNPALDTLRVIVEIAKPGEGKYRENLMREALKNNGSPPPRVGIFAYSPKADMLLLCDQIPMEELNGLRLAEIIKQLTDRAREWKEAISRGEIPVFRGKSPTGFGSGIFGLR
jgi:hypothetical protein